MSARNTGWKSAFQKTKALIFNREDQLQVNIKLDGTSLEQANRFKYQGGTLTQSNDSSSEIKSRLMLASTAVEILQKVWTDKDITLATKLRLVNALVYPVLLYSSEIWTIKTNNPKKLEAFKMRCYRKILNISQKDKIQNEEVLSRTVSCKFKSKRILARITESQLTWFGHVCRMNNMRHPKRISFSWKLSLAQTDRKDQGRDWKMTSQPQAPPSYWHIGMLRIDGLNLFAEPTSSGRGHGVERYSVSFSSIACRYFFKMGKRGEESKKNGKGARGKRRNKEEKEGIKRKMEETKGQITNV